MIGHLPLHRLESGVALTADERQHLRTCDRCQLEQQLLLSSDVPDASGPTFSLSLDDETPPERSPPLVVPALGDRYALGAVLGRGGMGEVVRADDRVLQRSVAIKCVRPEVEARTGAAERFIWEARIGAILQHPGVLPVHDLGRLPDGRLAIVMKEVAGVTFRTMLRAPGTTQRALVKSLVRVADTLAYAHGQGVVHRDLKPPNLMLGAYGEVWILDWGIAQLRGETRTSAESGLRRIGHTQAGAIAGTPGYMAPEQACGDAPRVGPAVDVYALGVMLHEVVVGARPTPEARRALEAGEGPRPDTVTSQTDEPIPPELWSLVGRFMAKSPDARPTAQQASEALTAWLDGSHRRALAHAELERVSSHVRRAAALRGRAAAMREQATKQLEGLDPWSGAEARAEPREQLATADELSGTAEQLEGAVTVAASTALSHDPDLADAHKLLAEHYRAAHARAEARGEPTAALMGLLRLHDRGQYADYIDGRGAVSLFTEPVAEVKIHRFDRTTGSVTHLETRSTPIRAYGLATGSYLLELSASEHQTTRIPVRVERAGHWCGNRPTDPGIPVHRLTAPLPADQIAVTAGWTRQGDDPGCPGALPGRDVWVDDFVMMKAPVTVGQYLEFLNELVQKGEEEAALQHAPRERPTSADARGPLLVAHEPGVGFALQPDAEGDLWDPDWPIFMVDWEGARAFAAWRAARDGLPWRLPWELEWLRAARGADRRCFPWGDVDEPTWAHVAGAQPGRSLLGRIHDVRRDVSPFGVTHLAGNVSEWMLDAHNTGGPEVASDGSFQPPPVDPFAARRTVRGGNWAQPLSWGRLAFRTGWDGTDRRWVIGFRLVRSV